MLSERDQAAVFALLIKQVEAQEAKAAAQEAVEAAKAVITRNSQIMTNIRSALNVFGFDMNADKPWDSVREALGDEKFNRAIHIGKREIIEEEPQRLLEKPTDYDSEDYAEDGSEPSDQSDEIPPANIREMVLEYLKDIGKNGAKVGAIKEYILGQGIEKMHDKTVGMTLYRLSKDGLAQRNGRTWAITDAGRTAGMLNNESDSRFSQFEDLLGESPKE